MLLRRGPLARVIVAMPTSTAHHGTELAYHVVGDGDPLICLPGRPMQAYAYLGDLGGLSRNRRLIELDLFGTGGSAVPDHLATYRCDRVVADVEALRRHLGLERMDLLGHPGAEFAGLFADARFEVEPGSGCFPWLHDAVRFVKTVGAFLGRGPRAGRSAPFGHRRRIVQHGPNHRVRRAQQRSLGAELRHRHRTGRSRRPVRQLARQRRQ